MWIEEFIQEGVKNATQLLCIFYVYFSKVSFRVKYSCVNMIEPIILMNLHNFFGNLDWYAANCIVWFNFGNRKRNSTFSQGPYPRNNIFFL